MLKKMFMRTITFVVGFCLALSMFAAPQATAEELKPFLTVKIADPETLLNVAEKIAELAGMTEDFNDAVGPFRGLEGINAKGPMGFVLRTDGNELKEPILFLPIKDVNDVIIPGFDMIAASLMEEDDDEYLLSTPLGAYRVKSANGFLIATPQESEAELPDDPAQLVAGLEKYTLAYKIDVENASLDAIEAFLAPFQMIMAMQGPEMSEAIENLNEQIELIHGEFRTFTIGMTFDPKTADFEVDAEFVPKKDSDSEKQFAFLKDAKTAFGAFLGEKNVVFSSCGVGKYSKSDIELTMKSLDQLSSGVMEAVEENAEEDEDIELAENVIESLKKILKSTMEKEIGDYAISLDADGLLLGAGTVGDTEELRKLYKMIIERVKTVHEDAKEIDEFMEKNLKKGIETVEGFKISGLVVPVAEIAAEHDCPVDLKGLTVSIFWGVKENEAIAFAVGPDAAKTEAALKKGLAATKSPVAVKQPSLLFDMQQLGVLLKKYNELLKDEDQEKVIGKAFDLLASAGPNAKMTATVQGDAKKMALNFKVDGKAIEVFAELIKLVVNENSGLNRDSIRDL